MKPQIATDREQSARLLACGVKPETADMCYIGVLKQVHAIQFSKCDNKKDTPAWSLSRLLDLLPKELMWQGLYFRLVMGPYKDKWEIEYNDLSVLNNAHRVIAANPIDACVKAIEWLTVNGYSLNNIKQ